MATADNLQDAFAGESQANRKYLAFAKKADEDGYPQVAKLFRAAAAAETVHAHAHLRALKGECVVAGRLLDPEPLDLGNAPQQVYPDAVQLGGPPQDPPDLPRNKPGEQRGVHWQKKHEQGQQRHDGGRNKEHPSPPMSLAPPGPVLPLSLQVGFAPIHRLPPSATPGHNPIPVARTSTSPRPRNEFSRQRPGCQKPPSGQKSLGKEPHIG